MWCTACGARHVVQGMWCKACGARHVVQGMWCKACGARHVVQGMWCKACGARHVCGARACGARLTRQDRAVLRTKLKGAGRATTTPARAPEHGKSSTGNRLFCTPKTCFTCLIVHF